MEFRLLGPIELWSAGRRQDLGRARARSILAMLLLSPRAVVPVETLIDRLWDTEPPAKARESLSVYVARLRASLREAVGDELRLLGRAPGYLLGGDPQTVRVPHLPPPPPPGPAGCAGRPTPWRPAATSSPPPSCCARPTCCGAARRWPGSAATGPPGCGTRWKRRGGAP